MDQVTYKYIAFRDITPPNSTRKTRTWLCYNIHKCCKLGSVKWYGPWRQYCYFATSEVVYSAGCLADIQDFLTRIKAVRTKNDQRRESNGSVIS